MHLLSVVGTTILAFLAPREIDAFVFVPPRSSRSTLISFSSSMMGSAAASSVASSSSSSSLNRNETRSLLKEGLSRALGQLSSPDPVLVCPISLQPLKDVTRLAGPFGQIRRKEAPGGYKYPVNDYYADLVAPEEKEVSFFDLSPRQDLFRSPFVSFLYERGWRDQFKMNGFPGVDKEFEEVMAFFAPLPTQNTTIVDLSCGSGLMTRRLVKSRRFDRVIAADYSESMLRETSLRLKREKISPMPQLIRADAARLPFGTESLDAIHAGAALHCWPRLEESLFEVHRALKPGGRFFATTFEVNERISSSTFRFFQLVELRRLLIASGFPEDGVEVRREGRACLIAKAVKAS